MNGKGIKVFRRSRHTPKIFLFMLLGSLALETGCSLSLGSPPASLNLEPPPLDLVDTSIIAKEVVSLAIRTLVTASNEHEEDDTALVSVQKQLSTFPLTGCVQVCDTYTSFLGTVSETGDYDLTYAEVTSDNDLCDFSRVVFFNTSHPIIGTTAGENGGTCEIRGDDESGTYNCTGFPDGLTGIMTQTGAGEAGDLFVTLDTRGSDLFANGATCDLKSHISVTLNSDISTSCEALAENEITITKLFIDDLENGDVSDLDDQLESQFSGDNCDPNNDTFTFEQLKEEFEAHMGIGDNIARCLALNSQCVSLETGCITKASWSSDILDHCEVP